MPSFGSPCNIPRVVALVYCCVGSEFGHGVYGGAIKVVMNDRSFFYVKNRHKPPMHLFTHLYAHLCWLCTAWFDMPGSFSCSLPSLLLQLLQDMWRTDPEARPTAREVVARLEEMCQ